MKARLLSARERARAQWRLCRVGFDTVLQRPSWPAAVVLGVVTGSLLLTHYWSLYLLFVTGVKPSEEAALKSRGIKQLVVTGCTTSICVESTIRDARFRDYPSVLLADCTGEPIGNNLPRSNHEASLLTIQVLFGWVSDSNQFLKALQGQRAVTQE